MVGAEVILVGVREEVTVLVVVVVVGDVETGDETLVVEVVADAVVDVLVVVVKTWLLSSNKHFA